MMKTYCKSLIFVLVALSSLWAVSAADTRIHINMTETVTQNVTFAENFYLVEDQKFCSIIGIINISNPSTDPIADLYFTYENTDNMDGNFTHVEGRIGYQVEGFAPGDIYVLHLVELLAGEYSVFNYTIDCSTIKPPLKIGTDYTNPETGINRKVLAGHNWTVFQNATNDLDIAQDINNINITIDARQVEWNGTFDNFLLAFLLTSGDHAFVNGNGTSTSSWWWQVNGGTLAAGESQNITYIVTAPDNVPTSDTYMAILETLEYQIIYLASNLSLVNVTGIADLDFAESKRIIRPADDDENNNVTWQVDAEITVPLDIAYNLTRVTLWVTSTLDPTDYINPIFGRINRTYLPGQEINGSIPWGETGWLFNFTDASSPGAAPPIVWMRPYFTILDAYNQIVSTTVTQSGQDIYMKYIYVVNGYWLQIDKNITNVGVDQYRIDTLVQNIGNAWTPDGLVVTAYDFVPVEFMPAWNFSEGYDSSSLVDGDGFNGTAFRWTIPPKLPFFNSSLGPPSSGYLNSTWNVTYFVNGTGDYRVSELYIVGLDPRQVDGAGSHQGIAMFSALGSGSAEVFYVAVVLFLVVINVVNFVMTRRINHKLNGKQ